MFGNVCIIRTTAQEASVSAKSSISESYISTRKLQLASTEATLTAKTESRATVEGQVSPANVCKLGTFPSLGSEVVRVGTVEIFASV